MVIQFVWTMLYPSRMKGRRGKEVRGGWEGGGIGLLGIGEGWNSDQASIAGRLCAGEPGSLLLLWIIYKARHTTGARLSSIGWHRQHRHGDGGAASSSLGGHSTASSRAWTTSVHPPSAFSCGKPPHWAGLHPIPPHKCVYVVQRLYRNKIVLLDTLIRILGISKTPKVSRITDWQSGRVDAWHTWVSKKFTALVQTENRDK